MKNFCIIFLTLFIISVTALGFTGVFGAKTENVDGGGEYLRMHVRAHSNEPSAQAVKYCVRDSLVEALTPLVAEYESKAEAAKGIESRLEELENVAVQALRREGVDYGARVSLRVENFPTRAYGEYILPAGEYLALIVELGEGKGDNWWCVVYPPLCFSGTSNVVYKSKILEILRKFQGK